MALWIEVYVQLSSQTWIIELVIEINSITIFGNPNIYCLITIFKKLKQLIITPARFSQCPFPTSSSSPGIFFSHFANFREEILWIYLWWQDFGIFRSREKGSRENKSHYKPYPAVFFINRFLDHVNRINHRVMIRMWHMFFIKPLICEF